MTLKGRHYVGHNPAASYAAIAMLVLAVGIVASGLLMGRGEFFEEVHGALAYAMLAVVVAHVCGVILHVVRHKENIVVSMFSGAKEGEEKDAIHLQSQWSRLCLFSWLESGLGRLFRDTTDKHSDSSYP